MQSPLLLYKIQTWEQRKLGRAKKYNWWMTSAMTTACLRLHHPNRDGGARLIVGLVVALGFRLWDRATLGYPNKLLQPRGSVDMDISATGWTNGDGSLLRVFEQEQELASNAAPSPNISQRSLHTIQSWEHSLRSRSPHSAGDDDESLISKSSSKGELLSPVHSMDNSDMTWTHE